jgi:hypothetical protein
MKIVLIRLLIVAGSFVTLFYVTISYFDYKESTGGSTMKYKDLYLTIREKINYQTVSLGYIGIELAEATDIDELQLGYSIDLDGNPLTGYSNGDWNPDWLVIGYDDLVGDPIFIDTSDASMPVYTAMHGMGSWDPELIAISFDSFMNSLGHIEKIARNRENPVEIEDNPLAESEIERTIALIEGENPGVESDFWRSMLEGFE